MSQPSTQTHFIPGIFARMAGRYTSCPKRNIQTRGNKGTQKKLNYHVLLLSFFYAEFFIPNLDSQEKKAKFIVCRFAIYVVLVETKGEMGVDHGIKIRISKLQYAQFARTPCAPVGV